MAKNPSVNANDLFSGIAKVKPVSTDNPKVEVIEPSVKTENKVVEKIEVPVVEETPTVEIRPISFEIPKKSTKSVRKSFIITKELDDKFAATARKMKISQNELINIILEKSI